MGRTNYRDSSGYARPVPLLLAARLRTAPRSAARWAWRRKGRIAAVALAVVITIAVLRMTGTAGAPRCHPTPGRGAVLACR